MTDQEQRAAAEKFAQEWQGKGNEKSQTHLFWTTLLRDVFGVEKPETIIEFERKVQLDHVSFIDAYIPETKVLIEQKNRSRASEQAVGRVVSHSLQAGEAVRGQYVVRRKDALDRNL